MKWKKILVVVALITMFVGGSQSSIRGTLSGIPILSDVAWLT